MSVAEKQPEIYCETRKISCVFKVNLVRSLALTSSDITLRQNLHKMNNNDNDFTIYFELSNKVQYLF